MGDTKNRQLIYQPKVVYLFAWKILYNNIPS